MASSENQAAAHLNKIVQITECSICMERLKRPKALPCIHTFCLECLQKFGENETDGSQMSCPMCRQTFVIPQGGFEKLPTNFFIEQLLSGDDVIESQVNESLCEMCSDEDKTGLNTSKATQYCVNCDQSMCDKCASCHVKFKATQSHKVTSIEDAKRDKHLLKRTRPRYCTQHVEELIRLYCYDCQKPICLMCKALMHNAHLCADLKESSEKFSDSLKQIFPALVDGIVKSEKAVEEQNKNKIELLKQVVNTEQSILYKYGSVIKLIEEERDALLDKLNSFKERRLKEIETTKDEFGRQSMIIESFKNYVEELIKQGSTYEISRSANDLLEKANRILESYKQAIQEQPVKEILAFTETSIQKLPCGTTEFIGIITFNTGNGQTGKTTKNTVVGSVNTRQPTALPSSMQTTRATGTSHSLQLDNTSDSNTHGKISGLVSGYKNRRKLRQESRQQMDKTP